MIFLHNRSFERLHYEFSLSIKTRGYSSGSQALYPACVKEFLHFIETRGIAEIGLVVGADIVKYVDYIRERPNWRQEGKLSDSMIRHHMLALRLFFDFLLDTNIIESSPASLPRFTFNRSEPQQVLTLEEIKKLFCACETFRDRAFLSMAYGCGLRRSEMEDLDLTDIRYGAGLLIVRDGKNHKNRSVPMSDKVLQDLRNYHTKERPVYAGNQFRNSPKAFLLNDSGERMSGALLNTRLKQLIQKTSDPVLIAKDISLHNLRHSIATHLLDRGADIDFVKKFLGHTIIDSTHVYSRRRKFRLKYQAEMDHFSETC